VAEGWRRLQNEELHNLYVSSNIIRVIKSRRMRRDGHVARKGGMRNAYKTLVGKPEGKSLPRCKWEDNIIIDPRKIRWKVVDWMYVAQDRDQ